AWGDANGNEIGDECNNIYGPPLGATQATNPSGGGTKYNQLMDPGDTAYVQHAGAGASVNKVTVTVSPSSLPNDGKSTAQVTVTVTDPTGAPVPGDQVTMISSPVQSSQLSCGGFTPVSGGTNAQGVMTTSYTASTDNVT